MGKRCRFLARPGENLDNREIFCACYYAERDGFVHAADCTAVQMQTAPTVEASLNRIANILSDTLSMQRRMNDRVDSMAKQKEPELRFRLLDPATPGPGGSRIQ